MSTGVHVARSVPALIAEADRWTAIRVATPLVTALVRDHEAIKAVEEMHGPHALGPTHAICAECGDAWPCRTIRTIQDTREAPAWER